ncbi:MAG: PQQ-like beta-propeller repeat protein [Thermoguttaceae bacterium]|nr:PQQ-like beta-propeller repeat protein [Thermoguttaceae bacterium]
MDKLERLFQQLEYLLPLATATVGVAAIAVWITSARVDDLELRLPGQDGRPASGSAVSGKEVQAGQPVVGPGQPAAIPGNWPGFRGPDRTGVVRSEVPLARRWRSGGPPLLWQVTVGPGHAGPAVAEGRVFLLDYDVAAQADTVRALSLADGQEIWRNSYPVEVPENHGSSRTVPAVSGNYVVTLGPKCHLACWEATTGRCLWLVDLVKRYGTEVPPWYTGQCPLVDNGAVIVAPAGRALMVALDLATGSPLWESPPVPDFQMSHTSITPIEFNGRKMYIYLATGGIAVVDAKTGQLLCVTRDFVGKMATCPSPVALTDGYLFFCGGYGAGSLLAQLELKGTEVSFRVVRRLSARDYGSEHQTPIFYDGYLFGSRCPPGAPQFVCLAPSGQILWTSGADRFIRGSYVVGDGLIYALDENGTLFLIEARPDEYRVLDKFTIWPDAQDTWGPMALVAGRLLLRDFRRLACLDVSAEGNREGP